MNRYVFISHSNKCMKLAQYFAEFIKSRGLIPIIVELVPNSGRLWTVPEKVAHYRGKCDSALIIATPDEIQDGSLVPRMDVNYEIGILGDKKAIVLKEKSTSLPTGFDPVYIGFDLDDPSRCLSAIDTELESIFGEGEIKKVHFLAEPPHCGLEPVFAIQGLNLVPWEPEVIQEKVQRILFERSKEDQAAIAGEIIRQLSSGDPDIRWVASALLEEILEYDACIVPDNAILTMAHDQSFSVRSCAAVCFFKLAYIAPSRVPIDVIIKLSSIHEDWYVSTPALATLKTLAHKRPRALDAIIRMAMADDKDEAEQGIQALLDVVINDPTIVEEANLQPLYASRIKYVREALEKLKEVVKKSGPGPHIIRYNLF